ncbi:MAG: type II toxin-antitoxin system PemK/MazF family toxin [Myxococcota bacterium]
MKQGAVHWFHFRGSGSEPAGRRPAVIVQHDRFNRSAINTTVVAAITSNLRLAAMPGNVRLAKGEAGLSKPCVVNVTQLRTLDKANLGKKIGSLRTNKRVEVLDGLGVVFGLCLEPS